MSGLGLGLGLGLGAHRKVAAKLDPATVAYLAAMGANQPTAAQIAAINSRIVALKNGNVWDKIYALYMLDLHNPAACLINVVNPSSVASNNGCTHTAGTGYKATGVGQYIDTGINVRGITGASKDNIGISLLLVDAVATASSACWDMGAMDADGYQLGLNIRITNTLTSFRSNLKPGSYNATDSAPFVGTYTGTRFGPYTLGSSIYKNKVSLSHFGLGVSEELPNSNLWLISMQGFNPKINVNYKMQALHEHLTLQEHSILNDAFENQIVV